MLIAIGRKMIVLLSFSDRGLSRSASTAMARPRITVTAGTTTIHSRVLNSVSRKFGDESRSV
jgi:hypothetical protein